MQEPLAVAPLRVSLVATVRNEASDLEPWLASIAAQARPPDEVVIVDGGSTDDTVAALRRWGEGQPFPVRVLEAPGANISRGRNVAIAAAEGPVIAVTDAGTTLEAQWLAALCAPFAEAEPPDVVAGVFRGQAVGAFQTAMSATVLPLPDEVTEGRFLPSSRSVAFRKEAWVDVGGYPEWASYCEDLLFDMALLGAGKRMVLAPSALVHFPPRRSLPAFWRQYRNYAMGDGQTNLFLKRHLARYFTYLGLLPALALLATGVSRWWLAVAVVGAVLYLRRPYARLLRLTRGQPLRERVVAAAWVPLIRVWGDLAKMVGYPLGWERGYRLRRLNRDYKAGRLGRLASDGFRISQSTQTEDRQ